MNFIRLAISKSELCIEAIALDYTNPEIYQKKDELESNVVDAVHAVADFYERVDKNVLSKEDDAFLLAFCYVNNQIKHDKDLNIICKPIFGSKYPKMYPFRYGSPEILWEDFTDNGSARARAKREHYDRFLNGKCVSTTLEKLLDILQKYKKEVTP